MKKTVTVTHDDYNTQKNKLVIKEYGRNIQRMIEYTAKIEDKERRNGMVNAIVDLMGQMNPHLKNVEEFRHKLWDHIYIISDGKLEVDSPYPLPDMKNLYKRPSPLGYPRQKIKYKHYGKNVETLVEKAKTMTDPQMKKEFTECIGNYMKLVYQNWNQENVNDLIIKQDMLTLSGGELVLEEDSNLDSLSRSSRTRSQHTGGKSRHGHSKGPHRDRGDRGGDRGHGHNKGRHNGNFKRPNKRRD